jgi:Holliday junction resolvasome RuvABC endonuclease subunit
MPEEVRYGIDPGTVNLGIAYIIPNNQLIRLYKIKMDRPDTTLKRILAVQDALNKCKFIFQEGARAIIEGASFGARYRQVELAEVRAGVVMWFYRMKIEAEVYPPLTIRKSVFGHAKIKNPWDLDDDIAAALACAYYDVFE